MKWLFYSFLILLLGACKKQNIDMNNNGNSNVTPVLNAIPASAVTTSGCTINWRRIAVTSGYYLYVAKDSLFTTPVTSYFPYSTQDTFAIVSGLSSGTRYYARISAIISGRESGFSNSISFTTSGISELYISIFAGNTTSRGYQDGQGTVAKFYYPTDITVDKNDNLYVIDNFRIRKITPSGLVSTLTGSGTSGTVDGTSATARINPSGICYDKFSDALYITDQNCIRKVDMNGNVTTVAGNPSIAGSTDGQGQSAKLTGFFITADTLGNKYFYQNGSNFPQSILVLNNSNYVSTLASLSSFNLTSSQGGMCYYNNAVYLGNTWGFNVIKIQTNGVASVYTGGVNTSVSGSYLDGTLSGARFAALAGIAADKAGNLYISDQGNSLIRKAAGNVVSTIAGDLGGFSTLLEGPARSASMRGCTRVAVNSKGEIFVLNSGYSIKKISYQ